jgi:glycine/D-amino acid oxidase-like deaminating enzyme
MDTHQWSWGLRFFYECAPWRTRENSRLMVTLSAYSREALAELRAGTGIEYDALERGILHYFTDKAAFEEAAVAAPALRQYGLEMEVKTPEQCVQIEPALAHFSDSIAGATYTETDESGDAHKFTVNLAKLSEGKGVRFLYDRTVRRLDRDSSGITGVVVAPSPLGEGRGEGDNEVLTADAYVVALGSYSPLLTRPIGLDLPIYPAKGYSATIPIVDAARAPTVSITDDAFKIVFTRAGRPHAHRRHRRALGLLDRSQHGALRGAHTARARGLPRAPRITTTPSSGPAFGPPRPRTCRSSARRNSPISTSTPATARSAGRWPPAPGRRSRISFPERSLTLIFVSLNKAPH